MSVVVMVLRKAMAMKIVVASFNPKTRNQHALHKKLETVERSQKRQRVRKSTKNKGFHMVACKGRGMDETVDKEIAASMG
jgi:hypothetical protein